MATKRESVFINVPKSCLILDRDQHRYQVFCSDIAGHDIRAHNNTVEDAITSVRDWLRGARSGASMPGAQVIVRRYLQFRLDLPAMCAREGVDLPDPPFLDYRMLVEGWLVEN